MRVRNNLNQVVRWLNTHGSATEAVVMIADFVTNERALLAVARPGGQAGDAR